MESEPESPENSTLSEEIASLPQAYAFTVHFDTAKPAGETTNKFARRHIRNLSLPISKVYENKVNNESSMNGRATRKAGNHSEGYFSSDPDDDSKPKLFEMKLKHTDSKDRGSSAAQGRRGEPVVTVGEGGGGEEKDDDTSSDVVSETGTYTIDKDSPEVTNARNSIDTVFGVANQTVEVKKNQVNSTHIKSTRVTEWLLHEHSTSTTKTDTTVVNTTKIPSPVNTRSRATTVSHHEPLRPSLARKSYPATAQEPTTPEPETPGWARETQRTISALQARVSQSLDSGGESDAENSLGHVGAERRDSGGSCGMPRSNRSLSLRRERFQEPKKNSTSSLVEKKTPKEIPTKAIAPRVVKRMSDPPPASTTAFARTDCGRFSMRMPRPPNQAPVTPVVKKDPVRKMSIGGSGRSNSTLSSKEKDYLNWKKRKSYNPMAAAAEGKKKDAAKTKPVPSAMTQSTNSTITTPKSPVNPVLRSASFHGTRQLTASSSEEEEEEITLSNEDEDWPVLQVPRSSLENTPQGSRVSLYSNNSNSPTPPLRNRPKLEVSKPVLIKVKGREDEEGVDTLVISALAGLSSKLKGSSCNLLNKLRFLYDEDSPKNHQLSAMIDQLEASEPGSPQVKSPSRELATTLRNLKRLESMLKVLDNVLFDEEEFQ